MIFKLTTILILLTTSATYAQTADDQEVLKQAYAWNVTNVHTGKPDATLMAYAKANADYQAKIGVQGHHNWENRFQRLLVIMPEYCGFQENVAESWPWQQSREAGAWEMFKSWSQSKSHWETANKPCAIYGYAMSKGRNGIWYGCWIIGQRRQ